jgi:NADPH2:quinone reductase
MPATVASSLLPASMKAIRITRPGDADVLEWGALDMPAPRPGRALIRVHASGINRPDILQRKGHYPPPPGESDIPGLEVAGILHDGPHEELAQAGLCPGQSVCALVPGGGYASWCLAPVGQILPVPQGFSMEEAASLPETWFTVWSALVDQAGLKAGQTLLVHGGSSGIGVAAIQLACSLGARVLVTVGDETKAQACLSLGAAHAIVYKTHDFVAACHEATQGKGVDVVLDMVAGDYIQRNIECLAPDGTLMLIAVQGGVQARIDAAQVLKKRLTIRGTTLRPRSLAYKAAIARALREKVWPMMESGQTRPVVHRIFDSRQVRQAHALMESGGHIGKLVLRWDWEGETS